MGRALMAAEVHPAQAEALMAAVAGLPAAEVRALPAAEAVVEEEGNFEFYRISDYT